MVVCCKSAPSKWQTEPSEAAGAILGSATIAWQTAPLPSGNMDIYLLVNGQPYLIEKAASAMRPMPRAAYRSNEIPRSAQSAAFFTSASGIDADRQRMYVRDKGDQVIVYSGYLVPKMIENEDGEEEVMDTWTIKRTIRYSAAPDDDEEGVTR